MSASATAIVGSGAWGTALAVHLARGGALVRLWARRPEHAAEMAERRENAAYLSGVVLPETVQPLGDAAAALRGTELVVVAVPSPFARAVYARVAAALPRGVPVLLAMKGIEEQTLALPTEVAREGLGPGVPLAVLSGPSFAREVVDGRPTAVAAASDDPRLTEQVQRALAARNLRVYRNGDPTGVQLAAALKNVMAIATGVSDGLGMGSNARAALITRGLAEITRLGLALGGRATTFSGLAGLGDLVLTCTGELSRNRTVGLRLGRGEPLGDILAGSRAVAEGVRTARSARELARRARVEMPIVEEVHRILYEDGSPQHALERLMQRPLTSEDEDCRDPAARAAVRR